MINLISKVTRGSRRRQIFVSALILVVILFGVVPVYAANYIDTFTPDPLGAGVFADVVNTGTATTGLTYTFTGDGDGGGGIGFGIQTASSPSNALEPRSAAFNVGTTERITIVSRDGNSFTFNDIWIDINSTTGGSGFTITGIGPEPFTITTSGPGTGGNTYAPTGGSKLVTSVEITSVDFYSDWIDDVDVELNVPGMGIYGNGILIVNGDATPIATDDTYFGSTPANTPVSKTFTIRSIGDSSLDLTGSPYITVSGSTDITVTTQPTTDPIPAGNSDTFTVQCNPSSTGIKTGTISILNNSEASPYTFNVSCTGTADITPPNLTSFTYQTPATSPTNASTLVFRATFDENVQNVTTGDFSVNSTSTAGVTGVSAISASTYDITVSSGNLATFSGTVGLNLAGTQDIQDLAGNALPAGEPTTDETYLVDHIDPSAPTGLSPADNAYTNDLTPTLSWSASTDTGGSGLRTTDTYRVVVTGTPSRDYYTANTSYTPTLAEGVFTWHVYARDNAGNTSAWSSLYTLNIDTTAPDVTINQAGTQADPTNSSPVVFTAIFNEPVNTGTFTNTDVTIGGTATTGTVTVTEIAPNDGTTFSVSVAVSGDGTVTATIPAGGVEDLAGNTNTVSTSTDNQVTFDGTKPDVTINQAGTQADPTNSSPIVFTAIFNEPVNTGTFTNTDVTIGGTATTGTVTVTEIAPNNGTTFSVSVAVSGDGTVTATIPAGGVEDLAGNTNTVSTSTDNQVIFDGAKPDVTINQAGTQTDPTNSSPVVFTAVFDKPINLGTFTNADVTIGGTATTGTVTVTEIAPNNGTTFSVSVTVSGDGTVTATILAGSVEDLAGNTNTVSTSTDNSVTYDTTSTDVTINQAGTQADPTNSSPIVFTALFNEAINTGTFTNADVTIGGTATTGTVTVAEIAPNDGTTFSVSVVVSGAGTVIANIPAGGVEDLVGNTNTVSTSTDNSVTYDVTKPNLTINQAGTQADPTSTSPVVFTVIFDKPINTLTFTNADVTIGGTASTGTVTVAEIAPNDGTTFSVSVALGGDGTVTATIPAGGVEDLAGNTNTASTSTDNQVTFDGNPEIDIQRPAATSIVDGGTDAIGNQALGTVNLTYTIDNTAGTDILTITGVTASSLSNVSNFSLDTAVPININGGATATFDISFDVGINGAFSFNMQIANNDADEGTYDITVSGTGTGGAPEIDIQRPAGTSIADGGSDNVGSPGVGPVTLTYTIDNSAGTEQLSVTNITAVNLTNVSGFTLNTATPINIAAGSTGTFGISYTVDAAGAFSFDLDILNNDSNEANYDIQITGTAADLVVVLGGNTSPLDGAILSAGPNMLNVQFNKETLTGAGAGSGENTANYLLVEAGLNNTFDTISCLGGVLGDDTNIAVDSISYNNATFTATLNINGGAALPSGSYRLFVCGTTSVEDLFGNELNNGLSDTQISFTVSAPSSLPETGFRHGEVTQLPKQPAAKAYAETAMLLEIPKLGLSTTIVGVPQAKDAWDVTWLGNSAGYLAGSAFPTWAGNTVITGHVWDAYNNPGIFAELKTLKYGDQVQIQAWGQTYTYEVRESKLVKSNNVNTVLQSEEYDWLTLITCEFYNPFNGEYLFRRAVRAVLVSVQ